LLRSESMGFGKPKKVGMPKRSKRPVPVEKLVPVTRGVSAVAAEPPSSPPRKAQDNLEPVAPEAEAIALAKEEAKLSSLRAAWYAAAEQFNTISFHVQYVPKETFQSAVHNAYRKWRRAGLELGRFYEQDDPPIQCKFCMCSEFLCCCTRGESCRCKVCNGEVPYAPGKPLFWPGMCICLVWGVTTIGRSTQEIVALRRRIADLEI
jgi:hypothetical protein